jgi:hypothetical protein
MEIADWDEEEREYINEIIRYSKILEKIIKTPNWDNLKEEEKINLTRLLLEE